MKITDFTYLMQQPCTIDNEQANIIEEIIETYPYFQAAHVLRLKALKKQDSFKYNNALKKTAAYTTNRTVLFDFITADTLDIAKKMHEEKISITEAEVVDLEIVVEKPRPTIAKTEVEIKKPTLESFDATDLEIGKPLAFDKTEKHSFNEWLQLTSFEPIKRTEVATEKVDVKKVENFELIDKFIATKPKIKPVKLADTIDVATESTIENESLMTETLARVYLEQKKYDKAIKAFRILSLKYPEKSGFFADRIKAVKFLQQNNT